MTASNSSASNLKGIASMLIAVLAFSAMDAAMKALGDIYSPVQVVSLRGWASLPFILLVVAINGRWRELRPVRWPMHLIRGLLAIATLVMFVYSLRTLSLSSAYAIFLCGPLLVTALSVPLLHERVDWQRWLAIAIGLAGVVAMIRPEASDVVSLGALAAFSAAVFYAFAAVMIRVVSRTETTLSMSFSFLLLIAVIAGLIALPDWTPVQSQHWHWIAILGLSGAVGQY
ncbi:MAG TPA: DMT family transporter, partial [Steroidobacteraceae bacterium]|nr:DMT family transporter [Steroidobacteraceae bacterium]